MLEEMVLGGSMAGRRGRLRAGPLGKFIDYLRMEALKRIEATLPTVMFTRLKACTETSGRR